MSAVLCSQCSAPLSMAAAQGHAPCGFCGAVNAPPVNPLAPEVAAPGPWAVFAAQAAAQLLACPACRVEYVAGATFCRGCGGNLLRPAAPQVWACPECRHENQAHFEFCLGCGAARRAGGSAPVERRIGSDGDPAASRQRSPAVLVVLIVVAIVIALAIGGGALLFLAG